MAALIRTVSFLGFSKGPIRQRPIAEIISFHKQTVGRVVCSTYLGGKRHVNGFIVSNGVGEGFAVQTCVFHRVFQLLGSCCCTGWIPQC